MLPQPTLPQIHASSAGNYKEASELNSTNGNKSLHSLAREGDYENLEALLSASGAGANIIEERDELGWTPLHVATTCGDEKAVEILLRYGANVDPVHDTLLITPMHALAQFGDRISGSAILKAFLSRRDAKDLLFSADVKGATPFHRAAQNDDVHMLKELLQVYSEIRDSVTSVDAAGPSTLPTSILNLPDKDGQTPLHLAAEKGNFEAVCMLLDAGASKLACDLKGRTPFFLAAGHCQDTSILEKLRLDNLDDVATSAELTALHYATFTGCIEAVRWLLANKASVDVVHKDGCTPLQIAAMEGYSVVIESLVLKGGANPLQRTRRYGVVGAPLAVADQFNQYDAAKVLVKVIKLRGAGRIIDLLGVEYNKEGAILLHYFAAYGTEDELRWILALYSSGTGPDDRPVDQRERLTGKTAVHWAAMRGNKAVVSLLAEHRADLNAESRDVRYKTPLALALMNKDIEFAEELLRWKSKTSEAGDWLKDIRTWLQDYYLDEDKKLSDKLAILEDGFRKHTNFIINDIQQSLFSEMPLLFLAIHAKREDIARFLQRHSRGVEDAVNEKGERTGRTALHWATLLQQREIIAQLCRVEAFARELTANAEDKDGKTALQYAKEMKFEDIEKELMLRSDVSSSVDGMYKDRQVYVDAANAILVGAALIAGVTFAGWLQPPLGYTTYYNLPELPLPSPPSTFGSYAAVQQYIGVRLFWVFNSLSFSFAIATMIAGLVAVVPTPGTYIAVSLLHLRRCLLMSSSLLGISVLFVLGAFAAAGFAVLPPIFEYQANMMATVIVGGIPCLMLLAWFASRLWALRPEWLRAIKTRSSFFKRHQSAGTRWPGWHLRRDSDRGASDSSRGQEHNQWPAQRQNEATGLNANN